MYNIIPLVVILVCLAIVLYIVFKKLPYLASFDVKSMPKEMAAETKTKIIDERLQRKLKFVYSKISPLGKRILKAGQDKIQNIQDKMKDWEDKYKKKTTKEALVTKEEFIDLENKLQILLKDAEQLTTTEDYEAAEKKYIEAISLDAKNIAAFRGLGNLYILVKNYDEARQTYEYILKLNKADSGAYCELAEICKRTEDYERASKNAAKALELEPHNPKFLDLFLTICIIIRDKAKAEEILRQLQEVNPENNKIEEFKEEISQL